SGGPNFLGAKYGPFKVADDPNTPNFRVRDVALPDGLATGRYLERGGLRGEVDQLLRINDERVGDPALSLDEFYKQGQRLITSAQAQAAFNIHSESEKVRDLYGRTTLGQRALLARRLVEAG